uniref:Uncharacterized protein n=1 Tax=Arundo donax TaxID=35708 RepID=A0A0A9FM01_ARUDO
MISHSTNLKGWCQRYGNRGPLNCTYTDTAWQIWQCIYALGSTRWEPAA